jgi:hypothetical protein
MKVKRALMTALAFVLRLVLHMPFQLLASVMYAVSEATEVLGDGFEQLARSTRQITQAPFIADWRREVARLNEEQREHLIRHLSREID